MCHVKTMSMKRLLAVALLSITLGGCASTQTLDTYSTDKLDHVNQLLHGHPATIHMLDTSFSHGRDIRIRWDSTSWTEQGTNLKRVVATNEIYAIEAAVFRSPIVSREGFAIGFVIGYTSLAVVGLVQDEPARLSAGRILLNLGVSLAAGVLGSVIQGPRPQANRSPGRFVLNERR